MDEIETALFKQGELVTEVAHGLHSQVTTIRNAKHKGAVPLADEVQNVAKRLDVLAQELTELSSRWHYLDR